MLSGRGRDSGRGGVCNILAATVRLGPAAGMEEAEEQTPVGQVVR